MMITHTLLAVGCLAAVYDIDMTTSVSTPSIKLRQEDTIVWTIGEHDIIQVKDASSCTPVDHGFSSKSEGAKAAYSKTFNAAGVFYYAAAVDGKCDSSLRGIVEVVADPVNPYKAMALKSTHQLAQLAEKEDESAALYSTPSIIAASLLVLSLF